MTPQLERFPIECLIGEGGMGSVYLAYDNKLERKIALKSLNLHLALNPLIRERFITEAKTVAKLQHPNIVTIYDYLDPSDSDGFYLVMEYVKGVPLDEKLQEKHVTEEEAIHLFLQVLEAFSYAHKQGIIHRDIKPSNIMIAETGEAKILDFGIAKILIEQPEDAKLTKTGTRMGTLLYMSPEQVRGKTVDLRTDIYSLGVTFYQMLTGAFPYDINATSEFDISLKIVSEPLVDLKNKTLTISDYLRPILTKATAKDPAERFQSCDEFRHSLLEAAGITSDNPIEFILTKTTALKTAILNPFSRNKKHPILDNKKESFWQKNRVIILVFTLAILLISTIAIYNPFSTNSPTLNSNIFVWKMIDSVNTQNKISTDSIITIVEQTQLQIKQDSIDKSKNKNIASNNKNNQQNKIKEKEKITVINPETTKKYIWEPPKLNLKDLTLTVTTEKPTFGSKFTSEVFITNTSEHRVRDIIIQGVYYDKKGDKVWQKDEVFTDMLKAHEMKKFTIIHSPPSGAKEVKFNVIRGTIQ